MKNDNKERFTEISEAQYLSTERERLENIERSIYEDRRLNFDQPTIKPLIPKGDPK